MREKIVGASSEHKHFSIRTQTRRVPQSAENTANISITEDTINTGQRSDAPGPLRVLVFERLPLVLADAVQPGVACETDTLMKRVLGVTRCVSSASLTQCLSVGREAAEQKDVIR